MVMTATRPGTSGAVRPTLVDGDIHTTFASSAMAKKYLSPRWHEYDDQYGAGATTAPTIRRTAQRRPRRRVSARGWPARIEPAVPARAAAGRVGHRHGDQQPADHSQLNRHPGYSEALCRRHQRLAARGVDPSPSPASRPRSWCPRVRRCWPRGDRPPRPQPDLCPGADLHPHGRAARTPASTGRSTRRPSARPADRHPLRRPWRPPDHRHWLALVLLRVPLRDVPGFQRRSSAYIYEGVFERFPDLKMVMIEGGFAWLPPWPGGSTRTGSG